MVEKCDRCGKDAEKVLMYYFAKPFLGMLWKTPMQTTYKLKLCKDCVASFNAWASGKK